MQIMGAQALGPVRMNTGRFLLYIGSGGNDCNSTTFAIRRYGNAQPD